MVHLLGSALCGQKVLKHLHMTPPGAAMAWSSWFTVNVLLLMPEEVWSFKLAERWWLLHTLQLRAVTLCGLTLWGWAAVVHKHFHFVILSLTADCGVYMREEMSQTDLLLSWHPITLPHWNSMRSFFQILGHLKRQTAQIGCLILFTCGNGTRD